MDEIIGLKITTLAENMVQTGGLGQWGLSFLLEVVDAKGDMRKLVFDTGAEKDGLFHNIKHLKLDLSDVECVVLSHGHGDHTAATVEIVSASGGVKVYTHQYTFFPRFYISKRGKRSWAGPPKGERIADIEAAGGEIVTSIDPIEIVPGLWTTGQVERITDFERIPPPLKSGRRVIVVDGEDVDDLILDDQSVWMNVRNFGPFVVTGCAHSGPINTLHQVKRLGKFEGIRGLVGGTHLVRRTDEYLQRTLEELKDFGLGMVSPCHCTGFKATAEIWRAFPEEFVLNYCCRTLEAGKMPNERLI
jgi:7,8-dihydropterin-6-yl-methyl-4-(beta-D-ribofuranosyl)aminobenzene 5'-phosphate synthase